MVNLCGLPDELILEIAEHLTPRWQPFDRMHTQWSTTLRRKSSLALSRSRDMKALSFSNQHLLYLLSPLRYAHSSLSPSGIDPFIRIMQTKGELASLVREVSVEVSVVSYEDLHALFRLPRIRSILLHRLQHVHSVVDFSKADARTSTVRDLRLLNCNTEIDFMAKLLSWPAQLKEFSYVTDRRQPYRDSHFQTSREIPRAAVVDALRCQAQSLEKVTFCTTEQRYSRSSRLIDLRDFPKIRDLKMNKAYALDNIPRERLFQSLPSSLEELEISYSDYTNRCRVINGIEGVSWLLDLLEPHNRAAHVPKLRRVTIRSLAWTGDDSNQTAFDEWDFRQAGSGEYHDTDKLLALFPNQLGPPQQFVESFLLADVDLCITLFDSERRFEYAMNGDRYFKAV